MNWAITYPRALQIAREVLPSWSDEHLGYVIFNETGYPQCWRLGEDGPTPEQCLRTQLRRAGGQR